MNKYLKINNKSLHVHDDMGNDGGTSDLLWRDQKEAERFVSVSGKKIIKRTLYEAQRYLRACAGLKTSQMLFKSSKQRTAWSNSVCCSELNVGFRKAAVTAIIGHSIPFDIQSKEAWEGPGDTRRSKKEHCVHAHIVRIMGNCHLNDRVWCLWCLKLIFTY